MLKATLKLGVVCAALIPVTALGQPSDAVTYVYDALGRLVQTSHSGTANTGVNSSYSYDAADNRTNVSVTGGTGAPAPTPTPTPTPGPSIAINDAFALEGDAVTFTVTLSGPSSMSVSVNYATAYGTADAADFVATSGTLTFSPGETSKTISVATLLDYTFENFEQFTVSLSAPTGGASVADGQGLGTIYNIDEFPEPGCGGVPCP